MERCRGRVEKAVVRATEAIGVGFVERGFGLTEQQHRVQCCVSVEWREICND